MAYEFSNNAQATLRASISAASTQIIIDGEQAELFPSPSGGDIAMLTLEDRARLLLEIVELRSRNGATLTISRAKEGTVAQAFTVGAVVAHRPTAGIYNYLVEEIGDFNKRYLGASSVPPTVDRDGAELQIGALYFDTTEGAMFVYTETGWQQFGGAGYDSSFQLPPGGQAGEVLSLDENLDVVWAEAVDTEAREQAGDALEAAQLRVLKAGDTMSGPLNIDSGVSGQTLLTVDGLGLFVEAAKLGNADSGWGFIVGAAGTADDKIEGRLNTLLMSNITMTGWEFYTPVSTTKAPAAEVRNAQAGSTYSLLAFDDTTTTVPPKAGSKGNDFVVIVDPAAGVRIEDSTGALIFAADADGTGYTSPAQTFTAASTVSLAHGLGRAPRRMWVMAKLKSGESDCGYSDTDGYLDIPSNADNGSRGWQMYGSDTFVKVAVGAEGPRVVTKTFGDSVLTFAKWDFFVHAE